MTLPQWNPSNFSPALLTFKEYLKIVDAREKWHPDNAYETSMETLAGYVRYEKYPELIKQVTLRGIKFEFRLSRRKNTYLHRDEFGEMVRDASSGEVIAMTDAEIAAAGYKPEEWSIAVFDDEKRPVASLQDEWGCVLIMVASEYRNLRLGLGHTLARMATHMEPTKPTGGFTTHGYALYRKMHREIVRDALKDGKYREWVKEGTMTPERAREIITSVDLSKRIAPPAGPSLKTNDPRDWLLFVEGGFAVLYDRKLKDIIDEGLITDWTRLENFIIGALYVSVGPEYGRIKMIGGNTPKVTQLMMRLAIQITVGNGASLVVEPDEVQYLPVGTEHSEQDNTAGYQSVLVKDMKLDPIDIEAFQSVEAAFREKFDRYGEFKDYMMELGDGKFRLK